MFKAILYFHVLILLEEARAENTSKEKTYIFKPGNYLLR